MDELLKGVPLPDVDPVAVLAAAQRIRNACGWHIAPSITETITTAWAPRLFLPSLYVTAVNSITVDGRPVDYDWSPAGEVRLGGGRPARPGLRSVLINVTHGYPECPMDVRDAVARLVAAGAGGRIKATTDGPFGTTYFDVDTSVSLDAYRLPVVA